MSDENVDVNCSYMIFVRVFLESIYVRLETQELCERGEEGLRDVLGCNRR